MACNKRLKKELIDIRSNKQNFTIHPDEQDFLKWTVILLPTEFPFNKGAFRIEIIFPTEYPFKPPKITFKTKIYHPNIDERGQVCLPIISAEHWKPATKTCQVLQALLHLISNPEPDHPLRADLAEEYMKEKKKFDKTAEEFTKKHAEKRSVAEAQGKKSADKRCTGGATKSTSS